MPRSLSSGRPRRNGRADRHTIRWQGGAGVYIPLAGSGIRRSDCYLTNVLWTRPPGNKLDKFTIKKAETPIGYSLPPLSLGKYLHPDLLPEIDRLQDELTALKPNLIVALGNTALWALSGSAAIGANRGTVSESTLVAGAKMLSTYHPAAVLRNWSWRVVVLQDLAKAKREMEFPDIRRTERRIIINPNFWEAYYWLKLLAIFYSFCRYRD